MPRKALTTNAINFITAANGAAQKALYLGLINNNLNIIDDGVERITDGNGNNLELQIDPGTLKLMYGDGNTGGHWLITPSKDGLDISQNGEPIISFSSDGSIKLSSPLLIKKGGAINHAEVKAIPNTGLCGFKSGKTNANGRPQIILSLPDNTFGKYRLEAWSVNSTQKLYSKYSAEICFGPVDNYPDINPNGEEFGDKVGKMLKKISNIIHLGLVRVLDIPNRIIHRTGEDNANFIWTTPRNDASIRVINKARVGNEFRLGWNNVISAQIHRNEDTRERQLMIKANRSNGNGEQELHYSIERIWEGNDWLPDEVRDMDQADVTDNIDDQNADVHA